ncbi:ComEC/Rec2 family competence protein [Rhodovibrio sodomensis]|uniref:ComEC/Rec2 family competence protein n=1 Tax=Rhodovibrio sodomensis TaxID=1088 RepID=UPI0019076FAD
MPGRVRARAGRQTAAEAVYGRLASLWLALQVRLLAERARWALWLPVGFGTGIAVYFALPTEPPGWIGLVVVGFAALYALQARGRTWVMLGALALGAVGAGFGAAQLRTHLVAAPILHAEHGPARVHATVLEVEPRETGHRLRLGNPQVARLDPADTPAVVRVTVSAGAPDVLPGDRVRLLAVLSPPPEPAAPGAYDFARRAYFERLGAVGFALGRVERLARAPGAGPNAWDLWWAERRQTIASHVRAAVPGRSGTVAAALMTGERGAIPDAVLQAMRDSGLAHLLAISGLHVGLIAGLVFFAVRAAIALVPPLAVRVQAKKWAALAAAIAGFCYLWLVGATVPTQRAFLMLALVLLAVALDRSALSMRLVAWAAFVVLLLHPESLTGASFQMSFAAAMGLVATYEVVRTRSFGRTSALGLPARIALYAGGVALTSVIAILATGPFAVFHFNRLALYGLAANLVAVPLTAFWIMPAALIAFTLMPLGLDGPVLSIMGWGVAGMLATAETVAGWPGSVVVLPSPSLPALALMVAGGLWLCLWRTRWRLWGLAAVAAGCLSVPLTARPDLLVTGDARLIGVRAADGDLWVSTQRRERFSRDVWQRRLGTQQVHTWPPWGLADGAALSCDPLACLFRKHGLTVALVRDGRALAEDCRMADVVVAVLPVRRTRCARPAVVIDRFDLWRDGAHTIYLARDGPRVDSVRAHRGRRPWVRQRGRD